MNNFTVYSKDGCPFCTKVISLLELLNFNYTEQKLGKDFTREDFYSKFGKGSTFPRVVLNDELIGGCTETISYLKGQKLI
jgi:glutaredoxin 3